MATHIYRLGYHTNTKSELVYSEHYFNLKKKSSEFSKDKEQIASDPQFAKDLDLMHNSSFCCPGVLETELTSKRNKEDFIHYTVVIPQFRGAYLFT
jgi:Na+-transporting NADH:ubiquinone oxidoreductase subunit NqrF